MVDNIFHKYYYEIFNLADYNHQTKSRFQRGTNKLKPAWFIHPWSTLKDVQKSAKHDEQKYIIWLKVSQDSVCTQCCVLSDFLKEFIEFTFYRSFCALVFHISNKLDVKTIRIPEEQADLQGRLDFTSCFLPSSVPALFCIPSIHFAHSLYISFQSQVFWN